jgi:four helix bundle protein
MRRASSDHMTAHNLQELATFRLCEDLMKLVEAKTSIGKVSHDFKFCNQLNDAALDAAADVAEGFARYYPGEFGRFLDFAIASLAEVKTRIEAGYRRQYFTTEATSELLRLCVRADKAARGLRRYLWSVKKSDLPPKPDRNRALNVARNLRGRRREPRPRLRESANNS